ncbi:hypothetical protein HK102_011727 [Quaeritorhiza haematococci]|nr:hypothetical protein HK102_011727 [Quaeritorhiza haematococci]
MTTTSAHTNAINIRLIPGEIYHPFVDRATVANFVGIGHRLSTRKDYIEQDAVMLNELINNDGVMHIVLELLRSWDSIPLLEQGLFCLAKLIGQARDCQLQLAWQWFMKPLWAIVVDSYFFDVDTLDEIHVKFEKGFNDGTTFEDIVELLLFYWPYPNDKVRTRAFLTLTQFAVLIGSSILENKPTACKLAEDSDSNCSNTMSTTSDSGCDSGSALEAEVESKSERSNYTNFILKQYERLCKFEEIAKSALPPELLQEIRHSGHSHYLSVRRAYEVSKSLRRTHTPQDAARVIATAIQLAPIPIVGSDFLAYATSRKFSDNQPPSLDEAISMIIKHLVRGEVV